MKPLLISQFLLVSLTFSASSLAQSPAGEPPAKDAPPVAKQPGSGKYAGIVPLINAHRIQQVKMVKLWKAIKSGQNDEKTRDQYKEAQISTQTARNKVTKFMSAERFTDDDRKAMNKMWTDELEKPVE